jgi:phospholipid/cholesterol/gamma-HCH transport system substrate-binding protein
MARVVVGLSWQGRKLMETDKNAFLVGLFVILVIVAGLGFGLWLTTAGKGKTIHYRVYFTESVGGLKIGSAVKFQGVDVGTVEKMKIEANNPERALVDVKVLKSAPVKTGTIATLKLQGLTGDIYIDLSGGSPEEPSLADTSKDKVPEIHSKPSTIDTLMTRLPEITEKMDRLLEKANHIASQMDRVFSDRNVSFINGMVGKFSGNKDSDDKDEK